jgi:hypothetical protein
MVNNTVQFNEIHDINEIQFTEVTTRPYDILAADTPEIIGTLEGSETVPSMKFKGTTQKLYNYTTLNGDKRSFYGSKALDTMLDKLQTGDIFKIQYIGNNKSANGYTYKNYKLFKGTTQH